MKLHVIRRKIIFDILSNNHDSVRCALDEIHEVIFPIYSKCQKNRSSSKQPNRTQMKHIEDALIASKIGDEEELVNEIWTILSTMGNRNTLYKSEINYLYLIIKVYQRNKI